MKTTTTKRQWQAIYRLLDRVSPVPYDCGKLCGSACCTVSGEHPDEEMGIYLYPADHWLSWTAEPAEDYEFPDSWNGDVYFVRCQDPPHCPRHKRPLQCRTYPLAPRLTDEGVLILIKNDENLPYTCPLIVNDMELSDDFIRATYTVWSHLIRDPFIYDLILMDSQK